MQKKNDISKRYDLFHSKLTNILNGQYEKEIYDWVVIKEILSHVVSNNYQGFGRNIVDFIDRGNWDSILRIGFKDQNRQLEMAWSDSWLYHASLESVFVVEHKKAIFILLKAYYRDKKLLNKLYSPRCQSYTISNFGDYMLEVERTIRNCNEYIQVPNINCYTTTIMIRPPIEMPVGNHISELLMHEVNLMQAINKFSSLLAELELVNEYDRDTLQEKGNTARRYFEYILMLINVRAGNKFEKAHQELMLGSLTGVLKFLGLPESLKNQITIAQDLLNACSHHGGVRIEKNKLISTIRTLHQLCHWVKDIDFFKISEEIRNK